MEANFLEFKLIEPCPRGPTWILKGNTRDRKGLEWQLGR